MTRYDILHMIRTRQRLSTSATLRWFHEERVVPESALPWVLQHAAQPHVQRLLSDQRVHAQQARLN